MTMIEANGRSYRVPERPAVVVCFDGCDPEYIRRGLADGILPTIARLREAGFVGEAEAVVPTFTNPNNASIVTGVPPAVHGISGNYYLDRATGEERMITDAALMRCGTILAGMADAGVKTAAVLTPASAIAARMVPQRISEASVIMRSSPVARSR